MNLIFVGLYFGVGVFLVLSLEVSSERIDTDSSTDETYTNSTIPDFQGHARMKRTLLLLTSTCAQLQRQGLRCHRPHPIVGHQHRNPSRGVIVSPSRGFGHHHQHHVHSNGKKSHVGRRQSAHGGRGLGSRGGHHTRGRGGGRRGGRRGGHRGHGHGGGHRG